jgi:hypothetical protein
MKPIDVTNGKIAALRKKETALKSALAAALVEAQRAKAKLHARECSLVGEALCKYADQSPDFKLMLKQVLASAVTDESTRKFLSSRGWGL